MVPKVAGIYRPDFSKRDGSKNLDLSKKKSSAQDFKDILKIVLQKQR